MGLAYLENGQRMSYEEYLKSKQWRQKKLNRLAFDNWSCGFCHKPIRDGDRYETHHVKYNRLGHENIETDIISLCPTCHQDFHNSWDKTKYWEQTPLSHWKEYSLKDTAQLCAENIENDLLLGGEYNLCSDDVICGFIDQYYKDHEITSPVFIYENDIKMFFRNKRYELLIQAEKEGTGLEEMLDEKYGKKGGKGGNPLRANARRFFTKHKLPAIKRIYKENANVNILMKEVEKMLGGKNNE